jgi:hypothetical protein
MLLAFLGFFLPHCEKKEVTPTKTETTKTTSQSGHALLSGHEIMLKDGELYEISGEKAGSRITSSGGKIDSYLQSPGKRYVAFSLIVGYTDDAGDYEKDEKIPQVPVHHIILMDLELKKQLTEIKPQNIEPFIEVKRWSSNEELELFGSTGLSVDSYYFYNVVSNDLRKGDLDEKN